MNYKSIKLATEAPCPLNLIKRDNSIVAVEFGGIRIESDYGLRVLVEQPFEKVKRHKITAVIEGFGTKIEYFDARYDAESRVSQLETAGAAVEREDVDVLIDDKGAIQDVSAPCGTTCDVPF